MSDAETKSVERRAVRIVSAKAEQPLLVRFLGPYTGFLTHYVKTGPLLCWGEVHCPKGLHSTRTIWKGFAPVDHYDSQLESWIPAVFEITETFEHLLAGRKLRGESWLCRRQGGKQTGAVIGAQAEKYLEKDLPEVFDINGVIQRVFHCSALPPTIANPVPPAILATPLQAPIPKILQEIANGFQHETPVDPAEAARLREQIRNFSRSAKRR